ncbi:MAG: hypothetical protein OXJ37_14090 [Bryobacterales bacterium]|nr:hypothetical protein [Bryobacterales bacterium]
MPFKILALTIFASLTLAGSLQAQGRSPVRVTLDDRLAAIEDRLAAIEDRFATHEEGHSREQEKDRLTLESEAKLDRLEVRVIRLETRPTDCDCGDIGSRALLERIVSLERQVARLRSTRNR